MSNKVPQIRFNGYSDDWVKRKLAELATMNARIGWQNLRTSEFLDEGDYILITGTDFKDGEIDYSNIHYVEKERFDQDKKIQVQDGSILITKDGTLGKVAYVKDLPGPATLNAGVFNVRVINAAETDSKYLFHYLKAPFLLKFADEQSTGGTIKHLNQNVLVKFPVPLPGLDEQKRIANLLESMDNLIASNQRKLDLLKKQKKGYLQKMFPKNGEKVPELRFAGFADDWEERKFESLLDKNEGVRRGPFGSALKKDLFVKESPYVVYEQQNAIYDHYETRYNISKEKFEELHKFELIADDFIMSGAGTIGRISKVPRGIKKGVFNQALIRFRTNKELTDSEYFLQFIRADFMQRKLTGANPGSAITNLVPMSDVKNWEIKVPIIEEQKKIGAFFKQLDDTIALHQRKLDLLKEQKKGYLQKMFAK